MSTPATPFAGAAPRLSPARIIAVIATSVLVLFGVLLGGRAFIAAAGGPDVAAPSVSHAEPVLAAPEPAASRAPRPRPRPTSAQAWARELRTASAKEAAPARRPRTVPMGIVGVVEPRPWARAMPASRDALVVKGIEGRTRT